MEKGKHIARLSVRRENPGRWVVQAINLKLVERVWPEGEDRNYIHIGGQAIRIQESARYVEELMRLYT